MTNWKVVEPEDDTVKTAIVVIYSEEMIIEEYFQFWSQMMKARGKDHLISEQNCIEDWVTINWATKTNEEVTTYKVNTTGE